MSTLPGLALQGSSEYNITVLIDQNDSERGLRAVHSRFYLSDVPLGIGIVGPGLIGGTLMNQLKEQVRRKRLSENVLNKKNRVGYQFSSQERWLWLTVLRASERADCQACASGLRFDS